MMLNALDLNVVGSAAVAFICFVALHLLIFRFLSPGKILTWIMRLYMAGAVIGVLLQAALFRYLMAGALPAPFQAICMLISLAVYTSAAFAYILCIFGPFESSIRLRLMLELERVYPDGITYEELLKRYNPKWILDCRLQRLLGSREIIEKEGMYYKGRIKFAFLAIEAMSAVFKRMGDLRSAQ